MPQKESHGRVGTGITGLDDILQGGFPPGRLYLIQGDPGVGKTTLSMQFLLEGVRQHERVLYITLSESKSELRDIARSHGWNLEGVSLFELSAREQTMRLEEQDSVFHPADVELPETTRTLLSEIERIQPARVVFDSLSELRLLAQSALRYRRHILSLKQHFAGRECTVLLLDDRTAEGGDLQLQSLAHGVIDLQQLSPEYGDERRRLRVRKIRGSKFRGGFHDYKIETGGFVVFPRLVAAEHRSQSMEPPLPSGITALDAMLGGGLDRGASTLLIGPAGSGKSALALQFAGAAARRGEKAAVFVFDEGMRTLHARSQALGNDVEPMVKKGLLHLQQVDPAELSPGEFAHTVRTQVDQGARVIVVDSLTGYLNAMPEERFLLTQMHELLMFLNQRNVATILVMTQHGLLGGMQSAVDVSYLADAVVLLRFFEAAGRVLKAISVLKRRSGAHEDAIRQFSMGGGGISIGPPLAEFHGVLTGVPSFMGQTQDLLRGGPGGAKS